MCFYFLLYTKLCIFALSMLTKLYKNMIAQIKFCEIIIKSPELLGELIKKINGNMSPDNIIRHLQRSSKNIRSNVALIEVLRESGLTDDQIFEHEDLKTVIDTI